MQDDRQRLRRSGICRAGGSYRNGKYRVACLALGEIRDHREARKIIRESNDIKVYQPLQWEEWQEAYGDFLKAAGLKG
mgnify:CR=1 FL=1